MTAPDMAGPLIEVEGLSVSYPGRHGPVAAVSGIGFTLGRERLALVGESGAGKTTVARALIGLLAPGAVVTAARLHILGQAMAGATPSRFRALRGRRVAMIPQDARQALNPVMTIGAQIGESLRRHVGLRGRAVRAAGLDMLDSVRVAGAARVWSAYPHELSGGQAQRAMIAMMVAPNPAVLIADEPTSALDVLARDSALSLLDEHVRGRGMGLILVSHDLGTVARFCDRAVVMQAGSAVETLAASRLESARHPYTRRLLAARLRLPAP